MSNNLLTIVTPTFDRSTLLERKLYHFSIQHCQNRIIIIDTSSKDTLKKNEQTIEKYSKGLSLDYQQLPQKHHFIEKIFIGLSQSQTPYTVISFDDDFLNVDNALEGCKFLHEHADYTSTTGYTLGLIKPKKETPLLSRVAIPGKSDVYDDSDPLIRAQRFRNSFRFKNPLFNVWRTDILKVLLEPIAKAPWKKYSEILFDYAAIISGKTKQLNDIFELRSVAYNKAEYRKKGLQGFTSGIEYDLLSNDFYKMIRELIPIIIEYAQAQSNYDEDMIRHKFIVLYLGHRLQSYITPSTRQTRYYKISQTKSYKNVAGLLRKTRYAKLLFNPAKVVMLLRLIKLYGYYRTGGLLKTDPKLHFNHISLTSGKSPYGEAYLQALEALNKFPD